MKKTIAAAGLSAALFSVAPTLALGANSQATTFNAMTEVAAADQLNDQELAAIEGQGGCRCESHGRNGATVQYQSQYGAANVQVQANNVGNNNNIASGNNVAILSHGYQASWVRNH